ncbi:MAG: hemerythrin domain-containing protein [Candidatus Limnocylindrales bacterium]
MLTLPETAHHHHDVLLPHVDSLVALADAIGHEPVVTLRPELSSAHAFLNGQLIPHMEMAEQRLYPKLQELLEDAEAMAPLQREHAEVRRLIRELGECIGHLHDPLAPGQAIVLRRILYRLFAILKVHLSEEEEYQRILERHISPAEAEAIARSMEHATIQPL